MIIDNPIISGSAILSGSLTITGSINISNGITGSITNAVSSSYALNAITASYVLNAVSASYASNADLLDGRDSTTFANTGSNSFVGQQNINGSVAVTGSLTTTGTITAQTINVQQVTSSVVYSSGSNVFGNTLSNTQVMTGSLQVTGSTHYLLGNVGIGTTTDAGYKLDVNGTGRFAGALSGTSATFSGNGAFNTTSAVSGYSLDVRAATNKRIGVANSNSLSGANLLFYTDANAFADGYIDASKLILQSQSGGNVGIGVTPSAWGSSFIDLQLGPTSNIHSANTAYETRMANNLYWDGSNWKYQVTSVGGTLLNLSSAGDYNFLAAPAGTAGASATLTSKMFIGNTGNVLIGTTTDAGYKLDVNGTGRFTGDVTANNILSGTYYFPSFSNISSVSSATFAGVFYTRLGDIITVTGQVTVTGTGTAPGEFSIDLPISRDFSNTTQASGGLWRDAGAGGRITSIPSNNRVLFRLNVSTTPTLLTFTYSYALSIV